MRLPVSRRALCAALLLLCSVGGPARAGSFGSLHDPDRGEPFWGQDSGRGWLQLKELTQRPDFPAVFAIERALGDHPHQPWAHPPDGDPFSWDSRPWIDREPGRCHDRWQWLCGGEKGFDDFAHHAKFAALIDGLRRVVASHHRRLNPVPEPGSAGLLLIGLVALSRGARRRG